MRSLPWLAMVSALCASACSSPRPDQVLAVSELEAYWAIDETLGDTVYVAPVLRFKLENRGATQSIEATATFRRKGEEAGWGSAWERISVPAKRLEPGQSRLVMLQSDGRYSTTGAPEGVFQHALFKDARVELFLRVGSSAWVKMGTADVDRRIGARQAGGARP